MAVRPAAMPASTNEMTTPGPANSAAASPVVTKIPAPTTLAMPRVVRLNVPTAPESKRPRSVFACARMASRRVDRSMRVPCSAGDAASLDNPCRMADESQTPEAPEHEHHDFIEEEREHRLAKLKALGNRGIAPYPVKFDRDHSIGEVRERYE